MTRQLIRMDLFPARKPFEGTAIELMHSLLVLKKKWIKGNAVREDFRGPDDKPSDETIGDVLSFFLRGDCSLGAVQPYDAKKKLG